MKRALLSAPRKLDIVDEPMPSISADEVLVRVGFRGVCTSELDARPGEAGSGFPRSVGHEVSGVVERIGESATTLKPGDRVAVWVAGGGFAGYVAVNVDYCLPAGDVPLDPP